MPEQGHPLVLATADGGSAVAFLADPAEGVWPNYSGTFFGVTSKLNVVHRRPGSYDAGVHEHRIVWLVGTVEEVHAGLNAAAAEMHVARAAAPAMKLGRSGRAP